MQVFRVGELARCTGLTVRALHHWDEIGLLSPSQRTDKGYRLYTEADVTRLHRVIALRSLGLSLEQVGEALDRPEMTLAHMLALRLARLREEIEERHRLYARLEEMARRADANGDVSMDDLFYGIRAMNTFEKYYSKEQLDQLAQRREQVGEERIRQVQEEWTQLFAAVKAEMDRGTDPSDPAVQQLAAKWQSLIDEFTGGDAGIRESLGRMYREEPSMRERAGVDPGMFQYISRAFPGKD
jgi:DNA-binding transcriptional MerR regulator